MMYSTILAANGPIQCYYNSERYLSLAMKNLSLLDGYPSPAMFHGWTA